MDPAKQPSTNSIARLWRGYAKPGHADAYEAMLKPELLPGLTKVPGYQSSFLLRRNLEDSDEVEFVTIILFDSLNSIRAVAGPDYEVAVVPEERRQHLARYDLRATHFEVVNRNEK